MLLCKCENWIYINPLKLPTTHHEVVAAECVPTPPPASIRKVTLFCGLTKNSAWAGCFNWETGSHNRKYMLPLMMQETNRLNSELVLRVPCMLVQLVNSFIAMLCSLRILFSLLCHSFVVSMSAANLHFSFLFFFLPVSAFVKDEGLILHSELFICFCRLTESTLRATKLHSFFASFFNQFLPFPLLHVLSLHQLVEVHFCYYKYPANVLQDDISWHHWAHEKYHINNSP